MAISFYVLEDYYYIPCQSVLWGACRWPQVFQTLSSQFSPQGSIHLILLFLKVWCSNLEIVLLLKSKQRDELTSNIFIANTSGYTIEDCTFVAISAIEVTTDLCNLKSTLTLEKGRIKSSYPHALKGLSVFQQAESLKLSLCVEERWLPTVETSQNLFPLVVTVLSWSFKMYVWYIILCSATTLKINPCPQAYIWSNTPPKFSRNHDLLYLASLSSENEVGKRNSLRAAKQSGFSYTTATVLAEGIAIELWLTKLYMYQRPEGKNDKKWTEQIPHLRNHTSHKPGSQQKTRRFKNS